MAGTGSARTDRAGATTRRGFRPDVGPVRRAGHPHSGATHTFRIVTDEPREQAHPGDPQCASAGAACPTTELNTPLSQQRAWNGGPGVRYSDAGLVRRPGHPHSGAIHTLRVVTDEPREQPHPGHPQSALAGAAYPTPELNAPLSQQRASNGGPGVRYSDQVQRFGRRSLPYAGAQRSLVAATGMEQRAGGFDGRASAAGMRRSGLQGWIHGVPRIECTGVLPTTRVPALPGA